MWTPQKLLQGHRGLCQRLAMAMLPRLSCRPLGPTPGDRTFCPSAQVELEDIANTISKGFGVLKGDLEVVKEDIKAVKGDFTSLKDEVAVL